VRQEALARTIFPLGELTKPEVREIARGLGLKTAEKKESQEICFIPDNDYRRYLRERAAEQIANLGAGDFVNATGQHLGSHEGFPFYTIGQRRGLGLAVGRPIFVTAIDPDTNTILVGDDENLLESDFVVSSVNWGSSYYPPDGTAVSCKIRYRDPGAPAILLDAETHRVRVHFDSPQRAITPGQSAVFYDGEVVVGGGVIERVGD
jgi:tRNA-specific 2-thiouridylase